MRPGQEAVIDALLAGCSALAISPTGGGKSLCYQWQALLLQGQVDALARLGIAAARLDSSLSADEERAIYRSLESGAVKLLRGRARQAGTALRRSCWLVSASGWDMLAAPAVPVPIRLRH